MSLCFLHQGSNTDSPVQPAYYIRQHIKVLSGISLSRTVLRESGGQGVWGRNRARETSHQRRHGNSYGLHMKADWNFHEPEALVKIVFVFKYASQIEVYFV